mgnify:CR=1 FL=1
MRLRHARLYGQNEIGRDALKHPITEPVYLTTIEVRPTPYSGDMSGSDGNAFTEAHRLFKTFSAFETLEKASTMKVGNRTYTIEAVREMERCRLIVTRAVKQPWDSGYRE